MATREEEQKFLDWYYGLGDAAQFADSGLTDEMKDLIARDKAHTRYEDTAPADVPMAPLDPSNPLWDEQADIDAAIRGNALVNMDPLTALVVEASKHNDWERQQWEEDQAEDDWVAAVGSGLIGEAGAKADATNAEIVDRLTTRWDDDIGKEIEYADYVGDATSDPLAALVQHGALAEYTKRAQGGLTPIEQAQMEIDRRIQERDLRSQRDAQLQSMRARGAQTSGLEVAGLLGAQQETAERRMLANMQQQGLGQLRADRALDAGAGLAGDIREQSFGESSFNAGLQADYNRDRARHEQEEKKRRMQGEKDVAGAASGAAADAYTHETAPVYFGADVLGNHSPTQPTGQGLAGALGSKAGADAAKEAADILNDDDEGLFGIAGVPLF